MINDWQVDFTRAAEKQAAKLNQTILAALLLLVEDLCKHGPSVANWPNYGKLRGKKKIDLRHCHLKKGRPTYVCCWKVMSVTTKIIEVYYVGTHEKAPY